MSKHVSRRAEIRAFLDREGMASFVEERDWERLRVELRKLPCRFRLKLVSSKDVSSWDVLCPDSPEGYLELPSYGPVLCLEIEWLEIDPIELRSVGKRVKDRGIDHTDLVEKILKSLMMSYSVEGPAIRIWAHLRKGQTPKLVPWA